MKKKLSIGLNYITISCALISIIAIIAMIILFQNPLENKLLNIAIIFCVSLFVVIGLIGVLANYQSTILDETGLTFKSVFGIISFVSWSEIKKISMLLSLRIKQIGANTAGAPHKISKKKLQTKKNVIPLHSQ